MFIVTNDQMLLPLAVIDPKTVEIKRPATRDPQDSSRVSRAFGAIESNIVRLIPGATRLPFGLSAR